MQGINETIRETLLAHEAALADHRSREVTSAYLEVPTSPALSSAIGRTVNTFNYPTLEQAMDTTRDTGLVYPVEMVSYLDPGIISGGVTVWAPELPNRTDIDGAFAAKVAPDAAIPKGRFPARWVPPGTIVQLANLGGRWLLVGPIYEVCASLIYGHVEEHDGERLLIDPVILAPPTATWVYRMMLAEPTEGWYALRPYDDVLQRTGQYSTAVPVDDAPVFGGTGHIYRWNSATASWKLVEPFMLDYVRLTSPVLFGSGGGVVSGLTSGTNARVMFSYWQGRGDAVEWQPAIAENVDTGTVVVRKGGSYLVAWEARFGLGQMANDGYITEEKKDSGGDDYEDKWLRDWVHPVEATVLHGGVELEGLQFMACVPRSQVIQHGHPIVSGSAAAVVELVADTGVQFVADGNVYCDSQNFATLLGGSATFVYLGL